jgi:hypothetical protein
LTVVSAATVIHWSQTINERVAAETVIMAATERAIVAAAATAAMATPTAAKAVPAAAKAAADAAVKYSRYLSLLTHDSHPGPSQLLHSAGGRRFHIDTNIRFPQFLAEKNRLASEFL